MATVNQISGVFDVILNLRKSQGQLASGVRKGLVAAGLLLQRESQRLAPVEFGNLRASAFTRPSGSGFDTVVTVGYTAAYALFVHEKVGMVLKGQPRRPSPPHIGRYWDPQGVGQAKFLEEPVRRLEPRLLSIVAAAAKLP